MLGAINKITREFFVGLDISDYSLEAVVLDKKGRKKYKIVSYARFRLSPGLIEDGYVSEKAKLQECVKKMFALGKPKVINSKNVFIAIPESKVFSHVFSLPKELRHKDLVSALHHQAEEFIPEPLENLLTAHKVLTVRNDKVEVFFAAVKKDIAREFIELFESMDMNIVGITIEAGASFAGLADELKQKEGLLLDIGARTTIASIFDKNGIRDSININIAGNNITDAIVERLGISHPDAENKKRQFGMDASINEGEIMWIIQGQMQPVADELKKFIHYYEEANGRKLEQLVMTGGTSQIKGLDKYFGDNLNLPVTLAYPFIKDKSLPEGLVSQKYINALGLAKLALQDKWDISFYQTERLDLQQKITMKNMMIWLRVIGRFFTNIPSWLATVLKKWYISAPLVLVIIGLLFWQYYFNGDRIVNPSDSNPTFTREIKVSAVPETIDNFIQGEVVEVPFSISRAYPGLSYASAVTEISRLAAERVVIEAINSAEPNTSLLPEIHDIKGLMIKPAKNELMEQTGELNEDFLLAEDQVLELTAVYQFLTIENDLVKSMILSDLPSSEAVRLNSSPIISVSSQINSYDLKDKSFMVNVTITLAEAVVDKPWYWPF